MAAEKYCPNCGTIAKPKTLTKGSFLIEVFLWLLLIVPGLIYSLWRMTSKAKVCPGCGNPNMIPTDSPMAKAGMKRVAAL
jgi:ribosomal protein S27AE